MNKLIYLVCLLILSFVSNGQTYLHPTIGNNSTYSGACPESTCSGIYYDNGGAGGNYSNNINQVYQTFCPDQPNVCIRATFTAFNTESGFDYLRFHNGPSPISPILATRSGTPALPFAYTGTNSSGCLTIRFRSDFTVTRPGWAANLSCVPCAQRQPDGLSDCATGALQICSNDPLVGISPGPGSTHEGCAGCANTEGEIYSSWYYFQIETSGTLAFDLVPDVASEDLDFALYGPNVDCGSLGTPVRCQYAANTGNGGMSGTGGVNSSGVTGPAYVNQLNVTAGQQYVLLINNWSAGAGGYTVNWTGNATIDCTPIGLPVELLSFNGVAKEGYNHITWSTASERDNDYFRVEKSTDGILWFPLADVKGAGNSVETLDYEIKDNDVAEGVIQYYRLKQFDFDGTMEKHDDIVAIINNFPKPYVVSTINSLGQEVQENTPGIVVDIYSNGTRVKRFNP